MILLELITTQHIMLKISMQIIRVLDSCQMLVLIGQVTNDRYLFFLIHLIFFQLDDVLSIISY